MKKLLVILLLILSSNQQVFAESIELERQECSATTVFKNNEWRLIGLPCDPEGRTVIELFEEEKFGAYNKTWNIFSYNTKTNRYKKLSLDDVMESHKGYWFIQKSGTDKVHTMIGKTVSLTVDPNCVSPKGCTSMGQMGKTWSLLTNPFHKSVKSSTIKWFPYEYGAEGLTWKKASSKKLISSNIWVLKNGKYIKKDMNNPKTTIDPWDAFWVRTMKHYDASPVFPSVEYPQVYAPLSSLFYQPLLKDTENGTNINWNYVFSEMKKSKMDTLILQWSKLGGLSWENNITEYDYLTRSVNDVENHKKTIWLKEILEKAKSHNIKVVIGLYHDEKFFDKTTIHALSSSALQDYFNDLKENHIKHAKNVHSFANEHNLTFDGWYITDEFDNVNFSNKLRQEILKNYLKELANNLDNASDQKYTKYISAFFNSLSSSAMPPEAYAKMLSKSISKQYTLMLHSGLGTSNTDMDGTIDYMKAFTHYYKGKFIPLIEGFDGVNTVMDTDEFSEQIDTIVQETGQSEFTLFSFRYFFYFEKSLLNFYQKNYLDIP